jgi:LPS sulfotransferase NodH
MSWKHSAHIRFARATGYQLMRRTGRRLPRLVRRPPRQLRAPVFIFSSVRSGSTLLRMILGSHSQLYAPHELHLSSLQVTMKDKYIRDSMDALNLGELDLTIMLWDQVLSTALARSGKTTLVEKTPHHVFMWPRLAASWPDARFVFLLRHPAAILDSWRRARTNQSEPDAIASVARYVTKVDEARRRLEGHTIRYEDLVDDPVGETKQLCEYLGVDFEPEMLDYGRLDHGPLRAGLGDWTDRIRTGKIQSSRPLPDSSALTRELRRIAEDWGY